MVFEFRRIVKKYPVNSRVTVRVSDDDGAGKKVITVSGYLYSCGTWYIQTLEDGLYHLSRLEMLEISVSTPVTIPALLEQMAEEICDRYCRYPDQYAVEEELHMEKCVKCALKRVLKEI